MSVKTATIERNRETLLEWLEECSGREMTDGIASRLCTYHGAYMALCMGETEQEPETKIRSGAITGNTEFEKVMAEIPADWPHMIEIVEILSDHFENLKIISAKKYENVMTRLREVASR